MHQKIREKLAEEGLVTLQKFVKTFSSDEKEREKELKEVAQSTGDEQAKKRVEVGNLKAAWEAADTAWRHQQAPKDASADDRDDVERSLPDPVQTQSDTDWTTRYHLELSDHLDPGFVLTNRYYREFRMHKMTVLSLLRMITKLIESTPNTHRESIPMGSEWNLERKRLPHTLVESCLDAYWCMRIRGNARAWAGNFEVDSKVTPGTRVIFYPMEVGLDYADRALRYVYKNRIPPEDALRWLVRNDKLTDTCASRLVAKGWPAGEATLAAIDKTQGSWNSVKIDGLAHQTLVTADEDLDIEQDPNAYDDDLLFELAEQGDGADDDEVLTRRQRTKQSKGKLGRFAAGNR